MSAGLFREEVLLFTRPTLKCIRTACGWRGVQILVGGDRRAGNRWPTALAGGDQHAVADHACDALRPLDQSTDNMSVVRVPGDDAPRNHDDLPCPALLGQVIQIGFRSDLLEQQHLLDCRARTCLINDAGDHS